MSFTTEISLHHENKKLITAEVAWHYRIIPGITRDGVLDLYIDENAVSNEVQAELEVVLGWKIRLIPGSGPAVEKLLVGNYIRGESTTAGESTEITDKDFVGQLLREAKQLKSSDIHVEIYDAKCRIRLRMDGKLVERMRLKKNEYPALVNKIKIMANLDISERRLPQDGRIFFSTADSKIDIRVSVLPTLYGEKIVLRLLGNSATSVDLSTLGFSAVDMTRYLESIRKPNGILLISGPTGSGKTTTLYATLKVINRESENILTVEDPIEYTLEGINQVQVKDEIGLSFSRALKSFLRQDPDIIMVGEIRDAETANLAIRAALTGHLVLSTIHTNSAWSTISRLTDMGIPPFLISNTLNATVAQRLVRLLCVQCRKKIPVSPEIFPSGFKRKDTLTEQFVAVGCKECFYTGFKGRRAIYEVIPVNDQVADYILNNSREVAPYLKSLGIKTLQESAFELLLNGETSVDEIYPLLLDDQY